MTPREFAGRIRKFLHEELSLRDSAPLRDHPNVPDVVTVYTTLKNGDSYRITVARCSEAAVRSAMKR